MVTVDDVISRLESRAANHGIDMDVLLDKIPSNVVDSHVEVNEWLDMKDVSHKMPVSTHPHLASDPDNIIWEDSDVNRARGAEPMSELEVLTAQLDNQLDAKAIDGSTVDIPDMEWVDVLQDADIDFDLDLAKDQSDKNPIFYLQYAHARICNIIKHGENQDSQFSDQFDPTLLNEENELILMQLHQVQEELERIFLENGEERRQVSKLKEKLKTESSERKNVMKQWNIASKKKREAQKQVTDLKKQLSETLQQWKIASKKKREAEQQVTDLKKQLSDTLKASNSLQEKYQKTHEVSNGFPIQNLPKSWNQK